MSPAGQKDQAGGDLQVTLAWAIRRERLRRQLRQVDLAARLNWPASRLIRVENRLSQLHVIDLPGLCRELDMPLAVLLRRAAPAHLEALGLPLLADVGERPFEGNP